MVIDKALTPDRQQALPQDISSMNPSELLKNGLKELDIPCSKGQIHAFMAYLSELKKWNRAYNLTALKTDREIIIKHFLDSLLYLRAIPEHAQELADIGSGAGFPGIPLKLVRPETEVTLIEASRKKTVFLRHIIRVLNLTGITVLDRRIETLADDYKGKYDLIVSRATFSVEAFLEATCPFVRKGGALLLNKGPGVFKELQESKNHSYVMDSVKEIYRLQLPFINNERNLVLLSC